jgi:hypothetical protein
VIFVDAVGQEGSHVRVTVDRRSGRIRQIVRIVPAPQTATIQPGPYEEDEAPPSMRGQPGPYPGPQIITREDIETEDLPPPGAGPRVVTREPDVTGNVPRDPYVERMPRGNTLGTVDPLLGVPPEFRNRAGRPAPKENLAARAPDPAPRATPMPRPRPADAPAMAQREATPKPPARREPAEPAPPPAAKDEASDDYPVQPLE